MRNRSLSFEPIAFYCGLWRLFLTDSPIRLVNFLRSSTYANFFLCLFHRVTFHGSKLHKGCLLQGDEECGTISVDLHEVLNPRAQLLLDLSDFYRLPLHAVMHGHSPPFLSEPVSLSLRVGTSRKPLHTVS